MPVRKTSSQVQSETEPDAPRDCRSRRGRHGFRGVPPPPAFDFDALPDGALLTEAETAAVGRWSTNTVAAWRSQPHHLLRWTVIAGGFIRYRIADIRAFLASGLPRKRGRPPRAGAATTMKENTAAPPPRRPPRARADAAARGAT
jgi:hypothetical protein